MVSTPNYTDGTWNVVSTGHSAGDPNGDILWQNIADQSLVLWQQDGATTTATSELASENGYTVVASGDLDGDGKTDYLMEQVGAGGDRKVLLSSTGTIQTFGTADSNWQVRASTDVDADGKDDVIWFNTDTGYMAVWEMNGASVSDGALFTSGYTTSDTLLDVYNGTGDIDSFSALWYDSSGNDYEMVTYTNGVASVTDTFTVAAGNEYQSSGDFNGDGTTDFFFRDESGNDEGSAEVVFTSASNTVSGVFEYQAGTTEFGNYIDFQLAGDFDNDGTTELMAVDRQTGEKTTYNVQGGTHLNNEMGGTDQADAIDGHAGDDQILGQGGDDLLLGDSGDDMIQGGDGDDVIKGEADEDRLFGGSGDDEIDTGTGADYANGGDGDDLIYNQGSGGTSEGGDGDDYLKSNTGAQQRGGSGDDIIESTSGRAILEGGADNDQLFGSASPDYMFGGTGDDYLEGGNSVDTLWGGNGDDVLIGGDKAGTATTNDYFYGGSGKDYFVLGTSSVGYYDNGGYAIIKDYVANNGSTSGDHLVLEGTSSKYTYTDLGTTIEIRVTATNNLVAQIETTASAGAVADTALYLG